jgi:hypothetical protein
MRDAEVRNGGFSDTFTNCAEIGDFGHARRIKQHVGRLSAGGEKQQKSQRRYIFLETIIHHTHTHTHTP